MPPSASNFHQYITDALLNEKRLIADPPADAVIEKLVIEKGDAAAKALFDTLISNIELPVEQLPELVQLFVKENKELPTWADPIQIRLANDLFVDHGPKFLIFLFYKSLPILYACANGAQVLVQTGRLAHKEDGHQQFSRRIAETGQFIIDVMAPGSILDSTHAIESAIKIRLIHASIRKFIPKEHWNEAILGKPINQEDLAITLMTFSISILDALDKSGIEESNEKKEAYLHTWKVIGNAMGIQNDLFPPTLDDARFLINKIAQRQHRESEAGKILAAALINFSSDKLPTKVLKNAPQVLLRYFSGDQVADMLNVKAPLGCLLTWLPEAVKSVFQLEEKLEDRSEPLKMLIDALSKETTRRMVKYFNKAKNVHFRIPENLKSAWFGDDL